jgi:hypothetical protein
MDAYYHKDASKPGSASRGASISISEVTKAAGCLSVGEVLEGMQRLVDAKFVDVMK